MLANFPNQSESCIITNHVTVLICHLSRLIEEGPQYVMLLSSANDHTCTSTQYGQDFKWIIISERADFASMTKPYLDFQN
jgi:hypothetical protein